MVPGIAFGKVVMPYPQVDGLVVHIAADTVNEVKGTVGLRRNVTVIGDGSRETTVVKGDRTGVLFYFYPSTSQAPAHRS